MRPGRILIFLLAVVLTLFILSLLTIRLQPDESLIRHFEESVLADSSITGIHGERQESGGVDDPESYAAGSGTTAAKEQSGADVHAFVRPDDGESPSLEILTGPGAMTDSRVPPEENAAGSGQMPDYLPPDASSRSLYPGDMVRDSVARNRQVRIVYYGDSQVEGDRVTSRLRKELRESGGGTGPGMISPVMPVMYTRSFVVRSSSNWKRYTLLDYRNGTLPHNRLGPMLALCRFTPPGDSMKTRSFATVKINSVPGADSAVSRYDNLRIFYGNNHDTVLIGIRSGDALVDFAMLQMGEGPMEYAIPLPQVSDVIIEFTGRNSPDIYALSLESETGVVVDNIPVRGSAGLEFVMTDIRGFEGCYDSLRPDIIFLHFGLNVVRNVRSEYHYYEEGLVKQVNWLKEASGGAPVVLVSVTDMALRDNDTIRHFPNIRAIRDAQRKAAERSGALFWDAWESMGGAGSIHRWYNHRPPLSSRDLTHLSNAGTDTLAARLYSDLLAVRQFGSTDTPAETADSNEAGTDAGDSPVSSEADDSLAATDRPAGSDDLTSTGEEITADREDVPGMEENIFSRLVSQFSSLLKYHPDQTFIFTTPGFWIFFLVVIAGFAMLHRRRAMCHTWLLAVSLYFYYRAGGLFIILLLLTTLLTWFTAIMTDRSGGRGGKRFWMISNIILLLGFLSYFKYAGFFTETINSLFHTSFVARDIFSVWSNSLFGTNFNVTNIILPVGISFFTFQALSYSIDVYRGRMAAERNFTDFAFYLTFFPQLVAGPIVRASEFMPQMRGDYTISRNEFGHGLFLIVQGLIKKMLISDFISTGFIDRVFDAPAIYSGFENLMAVYGYGLQIYCDFSGYTDIAIGVALLMGFRLPLNFNSPYKAVNVSDFWRRWHISLSRWLKDYLYIPLGGNRKGTLRTGFNLMVTMLLGGLWHGAATRFVVWGGLHGVALVAEKIWHYLFRRIERKRRLASVAGIILTFNFVSFAWIFFRAGTMDQAGVMISQIFSTFSPGHYGQVLMAYLPVIVLIVSGYILHFLPVTVKEAYRGLFIKMPVVVQFLVAVAVALLLHKVGAGVVQPFIYFRF
ncbi:MAG: hypothetical protein GX622_12070 [Bacteroidales bacterium]|nr:hypothetical protein [Bacteroidales bacterium]